MIADLGTRKGIETEQVDQDSFGKTVLNGWNLNLPSFQNENSQRDSVRQWWNKHSEKRIYSLW